MILCHKDLQSVLAAIGVPVGPISPGKKLFASVKFFAGPRVRSSLHSTCRSVVGRGMKIRGVGVIDQGWAGNNRV